MGELHPKNVALKALLFSFLCLIAANGISQTLVNNRPINQTITRKAALLLEQNLPETFVPEAIENDQSIDQLDGFLKTSLFQTELLKKEWFDTQIQRVKRRVGIDFTASGQFNEYGVLFDDDEDVSRLRVGVDMDLLDEGWLKWRREKAKLEVEQQIHEMKSLLKSKDRNYAYLYNCMIYSFNQSKEKLLLKRIKFLEAYLDILYQLYFAHELAFEKIIDQKSRLEEARILYAGCLQFNEALEQELGAENVTILNADDLPILQLDIEKLLDPTELNAFRDSLSKLENEAIALKYAKRNDTKLKLFTRYNWGDRFENTDTKTFWSFGATFRTPLTFDRSLREELVQYEKAMVEEKFSEEWYNRVKEIMILYEEYQYKLKQYSNFLHKIFHGEEKLRQERVLLNSERDVHSPMKALKQIDNIRAIQFELIHLKQQLYLNMLQIYLRSYQNEFVNCLLPLNLEGGRKKLIANRILIFEPSPKMEAQVEFLIQYLIKNEFYGVLLKPNSRSTEWATSFAHAGITVYKQANFLNNSTSNKNQIDNNTFQLNSGTGKYWISQHGLSSGSTPVQLRDVPINIFSNRNELERWIELENTSNPNEVFLFDNVEKLMELDQKNLGME